MRFLCLFRAFRGILFAHIRGSFVLIRGEKPDHGLHEAGFAGTRILSKSFSGML